MNPRCPYCQAESLFGRTHCDNCGRGLPWGIGVRFFEDFEYAKKAGADLSLGITNSTHDLLEERTDSDAWHSILKRMIVELHFAQTASARQSPLSVFTWDKLLPVIRGEFSKLQNLRELFDAAPDKIKRQRLNRDGVHPFMTKVARLTNMGFCTFSNANFWHSWERGANEAQRVLSGIPCCAECRRWAKKGWMPSSRMLPLGNTSSGGECGCVIVTRHAPKRASVPFDEVKRRDDGQNHVSA
jgi:hypothetical protein